jgi:hypothetical protein
MTQLIRIRLTCYHETRYLTTEKQTATLLFPIFFSPGAGRCGRTLNVRVVLLFANQLHMSLWDPPDGMKLFSLDVLDALGSFSTDEWSFDGETLRGENDEPFAVFGSREQQFIGIDSPDKYDGYMRGVDSQSVFGMLDFSSPTDRPEVRFCLNTAKTYLLSYNVEMDEE